MVMPLILDKILKERSVSLSYKVSVFGFKDLIKNVVGLLVRLLLI
jgi:hypothetical protein